MPARKISSTNCAAVNRSNRYGNAERVLLRFPKDNEREENCVNLRIKHCTAKVRGTLLLFLNSFTVTLITPTRLA